MQTKYNSNYGFSVTTTSSYPYYRSKSGETWTAYVSTDGKTHYKGSVTGDVGTGPLIIIGGASLTVNKGAVVDGLTFVPSVSNLTYVTVTNNGTIENSTLIMVAVTNNGVSENNQYVGFSYTGASGSSSKGDFMYSVGLGTGTIVNEAGTQISAYQLANASATSTVTLNSGSSFDSYFAVASSASTDQPNIYPKGTMTIQSGATIACFLAGTMITTVNGLVAIEDIQVGDQVVTYQDNKEEIRAVIWTGYNTVKVNTSLFEDEANYPVRIVRNAIAEGVPAKDLLVTSEHCILLNGQFVPVRMLVNDASIFYDYSITEYTYYHIETEAHSVIKADNVLTETYLDSGNRSSFISDHNIVSIVSKRKEWNVDSAAPLTTTRVFVEPIFHELNNRAKILGIEYKGQPFVTTEDPELCLIANTGEVISVSQQNKDHFIFKIPSHVTNVNLVSRVCKPSRAIGPFVNDRRNLGILVGDVTLLERNASYKITDHLTSFELSGWEGEPSSLYRWTTGRALLDIRSKPSNGIGMLVVQVVSAGPYVIQGEMDLQKKAA